MQADGDLAVHSHSDRPALSAVLEGMLPAMFTVPAPTPALPNEKANA